VSAGMALSIFGCFAMTELRGGSFVRGIETVGFEARAGPGQPPMCELLDSPPPVQVARFVPGAGEDGDGEFDIHTPSISASKWWIGGGACAG
jgi:hypothetical protein